MIDPIIKQDLQVVKAHFENEALKQGSDKAVYVASSSMLRDQSVTHQAITAALKTYPSYYARDQRKTQARSSSNSTQNECIPCLDRIKDIWEADLSSGWAVRLNSFDDRLNTALGNLFRAMEYPSNAASNLCDIYLALKSQCVPDLKRAVALLAFLISDLLNVEVPKLKDVFISIIMKLVGSYLINSGLGLDKFNNLILLTMRCVINDIKTQLEKLEPILTKEGQAKAKKQLTGKTHPSGHKELPPNKKIYDKLDQVEATTTGALNLIESTLEDAMKKLTYYNGGAQIDLAKLLNANQESLLALGNLIKKVRDTQELLSLLQSMVANKSDKNPCGSEQERARRYFRRVNLPGQTVIVQPPTPNPDETYVDNDPDNVEIIITPNPIVVTNPIIKDILAKQGIEFVETDGSGTTPLGTTVVKIPPTSINLFGCLGRMPAEE